MHQAIRRYLFPLTMLATAATLFWLVFAPVGGNDTFFGIAIGKYIVTRGEIPTHEVFSWSAQGRPWIAYEWLAQSLLYVLYALGGLPAISIWVSLTFVLFFILFYLLVTTVLGNDRWLGLVLSGFTSVAVSGFFVARPQIISFLALITTFTLIMRFLLHGKDRLWWIIPITYLWANSHASFIMSPILLFFYAILTAKKRLAVIGVFTTLITFAPPLWHKPYALLFEFTGDMEFISRSVSEWAQLMDNPLFLRLYGVFLIVILAVSLFLSWKKNLWRQWLLTLPLLVISILSFQAVRHLVYGTIATVVLFSFFTPTIRFRSPTRIVASLLSLILLFASVWLGYQTRPDPNPPLPSQMDVQFLKDHHINGHIYNEFSLGGFLMYALRPQYQVFFDGRVEVYHCCEMRGLWPLIEKKHAGRETFQNALYSFLKTYQFSAVIVPYTSYNPMEFTVSSYAADILLDDPNWALVWASDYLQILVARDGKNDALISQFAMPAATPYRLVPYRPGREKDAVADYERLERVGKSGIGLTGLGTAALATGDNKKAAAAYQNALQLNPRLGKPYVGLGKLALADKNTKQAIAFLELALAKEAYLGEASILLGQAYRETGRTRDALTLWNKTLKEPIDFISKQKIVQLIAGTRQGP